MKISVNNISNKNSVFPYNQHYPQYISLSNQKGDSFCKSEKQISFGSNSKLHLPKIVNEFLNERLYSIFDDYKTFGVNEYKKLTRRQKHRLRNFYPFPKEDLTNILKMHNKIEQSLNKYFPYGYTFVAIGRSPALFAKIFEFKGIDSKICPISKLNIANDTASVLKSSEVSKYGEYLKEMGISKETVKNATKPFIFTDYTVTGASLRNFENILARDEIGIKSGKNAKFISLNKKLLTPKQTALIDKYLLESAIKEYSPTPYVLPCDIGKIKKIVQEPQSKEAKLMEFHIIDFILGGKSLDLTY